MDWGGCQSMNALQILDALALHCTALATIRNQNGSSNALVRTVHSGCLSSLVCRELPPIPYGAHSKSLCAGVAA